MQALLERIGADPYGCFVGAPLVVGGPGLGVAVKDNIDVAGWPTRAGMGGPGRRAAADAAVVARLRAAGCTLLGKTRMDEAALGASGENAWHGRTLNPRVPGGSPGGSSGGAAACVAAGYAEAALGTDTLGSVRIPASFCGVVGFKPSRGVLPLEGVVGLAPSFDHVGVLGRDVAVVAWVFGVCAGGYPSPQSSPARGEGAGSRSHPSSRAVAIQGPQSAGRWPLDRHASLAMTDAHGPDIALRISVLDGLSMSPAVDAAFRAAMARLALAGWRVREGPVPDWEPGRVRRAAFLLVENEAAGLFDADDPRVSPGLQRLLVHGRDVAAEKLAAARGVVDAAAAGLGAVLAGGGLVAMPTTPDGAFAWGDRMPASIGDLTALANIGGQPAVSVPGGALPDGRPWGLQLIGAVGDDARVLAAAAFAERVLGL